MHNLGWSGYFCENLCESNLFQLMFSVHLIYEILTEIVRMWEEVKCECQKLNIGCRLAERESVVC